MAARERRFILAAWSIPSAVAVWGLASAVGIALLGILTLMGGRSRPRGALAFGAFAILWGLQIFLGHLAGILDGWQGVRVLYGLVLVCLIPLPYFLVEFAGAQTEERQPFWRMLRIGFRGLAILVAAVFALSPGLLYRGVFEFNGHLIPDYGPLHVPLITLPFFVSFALALFALATVKDRSPTIRTSTRAALLLGGLGVYVAFAAGNNLVFYLTAAFYDAATDSLRASAFFETDANTLMFVMVFAALSAMTAWLGVRAFLQSRVVPTSVERRRERLLAFALLAPLAWGAAEAWLAYSLVPRLETVGLWRLAGVGVIAYGVARWRFYDLPQRAVNVAAVTTGTAAAAASGAAAYGAGTLVTQTAIAPAVAGLIVLASLYLPSIRFARRLFRLDERKGTLQNEETLYGQRIDAYRAALEASIARGTLEQDADFLAALRARFNITEAEERVLLHYARSSVVVFRDRNAWDAYERLRLLGEGGGGRTWLARDRARDRLVVLKEPLERWQQDPATREAVLREARLAAKVRHPNVVSVEEVVEGHGTPVIVMEYLDGGSLRDLLRSRGTLPWREAVNMTIEVLRGVEAVHAAGIIHRDIKPSNVLLDSTWNPKIADFGIALPPSSNKTVIDGASTLRAGTYLYMAPEVRSGFSIGDKRADLYACAVLLHECLFGAPPGAGSPVVVRGDVPQSLTDVLARGLSERPEDRPASARAFAEDLARLLRL